MRRLIVLFVICLSPPALAGEWLTFDSRTPAGPTALLAGEGDRVAIRGLLNLPPDARRPVPAMVLMHGSGGILPDREEAWEKRLNDLGVATFLVDSFTPRGIRSTANAQDRLPLSASVADAFGALALLSRDSRIIADRIGVMGFSKGGQVALYSALEPFRRAALGPGAPSGTRFALHIALYASCSIPYKAEAITGAPMLLLLGGADDYTPARHCARYADWFRSKAAPVRIAVYPDAYHGFDTAEPPRRLPRVQSARDCGLDIELEPVLGRRWDGTTVAPDEIAGYLKSCMQRGATFGGNPEALHAAIEDVRRETATTLLRP